MLVGFVRFFRGWVEFSTYGKFPERLLNITSRYGIKLWDAKPVSGGLDASMSVSDYRKIRRIAKKARVRTKITKKHGLPFIAAKYKKRIGLPIGALLGIVMLLVLSNFIWSISITGTETVSDTRLLEVLAENGVDIGRYKNNLDAKKIKRDALLEVDEVGWMSVNITGSLVSVEVKEKAQKPEINQFVAPCNVKAKCDGVITDINAKNGETVVKKGSGVTEGDLLVSGTLLTKLETTRYVHAEAEVYADVISDKELSLPVSFDYYSLTENKTDRNRLKFLWLEIPFLISFSSYENSAYSETTRNICANDVALPMQIKTETAYEVQHSQVTLDDELAQQVFDNQMLLYEVFEKDGSRVVSRNISMSTDENFFHCMIDYVFNENIAQSVEFSVTE